MDVSDARRLKEMEAENARLTHLFADAMPDNVAISGVVSRKW